MNIFTDQLSRERPKKGEASGCEHSELAADREPMLGPIIGENNWWCLHQWKREVMVSVGRCICSSRRRNFSLTLQNPRIDPPPFLEDPVAAWDCKTLEIFHSFFYFYFFQLKRWSGGGEYRRPPPKVFARGFADYFSGPSRWSRHRSRRIAWLLLKFFIIRHVLNYCVFASLWLPCK